jgi:hypothetical protein
MEKNDSRNISKKWGSVGRGVGAAVPTSGRKFKNCSKEIRTKRAVQNWIKMNIYSAPKKC